MLYYSCSNYSHIQIVPQGDQPIAVNYRNVLPQWPCKRVKIKKIPTANYTTFIKSVTVYRDIQRTEQSATFSGFL